MPSQPIQQVAHLLSRYQGWRIWRQRPRGQNEEIGRLRRLHKAIELLALGEVIGEAGLFRNAKPSMHLSAAEVEIHHQRLLARSRKQLREIHDRRRLAFLRRRARDQNHLARVLAPSEDEGRPQVLVRLGDEMDVRLVILRHSRQKLEMQEPLDLVGVLDGVVQIVAAQNQKNAKQQTHRETHEGGAPLVGPDLHTTHRLVDQRDVVGLHR